MTITPQWKDELRARVTLSSVVNRTTKLIRKGNEWTACCPFHDEKTPSFYVNDQKQFYHCFGCGAHGDVISWMIEQRGLSFMDAIKELAAEAGMEVPAPDPVAAKRAEKRAGLVDVTSEAQDWFVHNLHSAEGQDAMRYLTHRGLKPETLREFGFGYAPENKQALAQALKHFDEQMLVETGMRIRTDDGTTYDRFRGRVMLPIQDARGRVIAFGGRILEKRDGVAKYLNSPDTPLFDKGRNLYNLHRAATASRQSGRVIVVEGYMDVVALAQAGFSDAVAPMGTALTEMQLEMLWRMVETPILCFDGDNAGQKAAVRAMERALPLLKSPNSLQFVQLPSGKDPDDILRAKGGDYFEELLAEGVSLLRFIWETECRETNFDRPEDKAHLKQRLIDRAQSFGDAELGRQYQRSLMDLYFKKVFPKRSSNGQSKYGLVDSDSLARLRYFVEDGSREHLIKAVFSALARNPNLIEKHIDRLTKFIPQTNEVFYVLEVFCDAAISDLDSVDEPFEALAEIASWSNPLPYPFLRHDTPAEVVDKYVSEALTILVDIPAAQEEVQKATEDLMEYGDEHHERQQNYWVKRLAELRSTVGIAWKEDA